MKREHGKHASGVAALLVFSSSPSLAITVPYAVGMVNACVGTSCDVFDSDIETPNGLAQINSTVGSAAQGVTANVQASGNAGYGTLSASASISYNITGSPKLAFSDGTAFFDDLVTVSFAPWNGQPGLMYVQYNLTGTITESGSANAFVLVGGAGGTSSEVLEQSYFSSTSGTFFLTAPLHFVYGQPFELDFQLIAVAGTITPNPTIFPGVFDPVVGAGSGDANFFDTFVLSGLTPTDINGNVATGAQFSSASGHSIH